MTDLAQKMHDAWFDGTRRRAVMVRWLFTEWCNYRCPYCPQTHERYAPKGGEMTAHAFDNFPVTEWLAAFDRHFGGQALSIVFTGGEPLIDKTNMNVLLGHLTQSDYVKHIRIDTNMSFKAEWYAGLDKSKILVTCTFHPSQVEEERFLRHLDAALAAGFMFGKINYVMDASQKDQYRAFRDRMWARGIPVQPNPLWGSKGEYEPGDLELMRESMPPRDFALKAQIEVPRGAPCLFPAVGYEMNAVGQIQTGCHAETRQSFFAEALPPSPASYSPCPHQECVCLDKYSFLKDFARNVTTNPFGLYAEELKRTQLVRTGAAG